MTGCWAFVVGPTGAGKDSVINTAQGLLSTQKNIVFARRLVTRPSQAGSEHDPIREHEFGGLMQSGGLSWHWYAHGYFYGIAAHYTADVSAGQLVVVNGSRAHVNSLPGDDKLKVIEISASQSLLATRLQQRGRDDPQAVAIRLSRNSSLGLVRTDCVVTNDGALSIAGQQLADYLMATAKQITG